MSCVGRCSMVRASKSRQARAGKQEQVSKSRRARAGKQQASKQRICGKSEEREEEKGFQQRRFRELKYVGDLKLIWLQTRGQSRYSMTINFTDSGGVRRLYGASSEFGVVLCLDVQHSCRLQGKTPLQRRTIGGRMAIVDVVNCYYCH